MKYITSIFVISALFSNSLGLNGSLKGRLGKNLAQLESSIEASQSNQSTFLNQTSDCTLAPLPALTLNCPCNVTVQAPVVQGAAQV